jgi:hypothetical protein
MQNGIARTALWIAATFACRIATAEPVTLPNNFTAGTAARAAEINANFDALGTAVNANDARIAALEASAVAADVAPRGNVLLGASTATAGNILKQGRPFVHNFGVSNTFVGVDAGNLTTTGFSNTASGANALFSNTTGFENTANGADALAANLNGTRNTAVGAAALTRNVEGGQNVAVGRHALVANTRGSSNTAVGSLALGANLEGGGNVAVGSGALGASTSSYNTAIGYRALRLNTTEGGMTAVGSFALEHNTTGDGNTALGYHALANNTTGNTNVAVGHWALQANTTGGVNTVVGRNAMAENVSGGRNTVIGYGALGSSTTGSFNVAVGGALYKSTGDWNIAIGETAGELLTSGNQNIYVGNPGAATESKTIRIGTGAVHTRTFVAGVRNVTTGQANAINVVVDSAGQLGTLSSSRDVKDEIADMGEASGVLGALRPVTFYYKSDQDPAGRTRQYGLVAEEVAAVAPELVARSADGRIETVYYQFLPPMLVHEYQRQQRTIAALTARVAELEQDVLNRIGKLEQHAARSGAPELLANAPSTGEPQ